MKINPIIQYGGKDIDLKDVEKQIREEWKNSGRLVKEIKELHVYVKPEENMCYYVVNEEPVRSLSL